MPLLTMSNFQQQTITSIKSSFEFLDSFGPTHASFCETDGTFPNRRVKWNSLTGAWASTHRGKCGQLTPCKNGWKIKKRKHAKNSFICLCYILRAIGAGRCRQRRYADHIFIQIHFRMPHFVVKFSKFSSSQVTRGHWPPYPKSCGRSWTGARIGRRCVVLTTERSAAGGLRRSREATRRRPTWTTSGPWRCTEHAATSLQPTTAR